MQQDNMKLEEFMDRWFRHQTDDSRFSVLDFMKDMLPDVDPTRYNRAMVANFLVESGAECKGQVRVRDHRPGHEGSGGIMKDVAYAAPYADMEAKRAFMVAMAARLDSWLTEGQPVDCSQTRTRHTAGAIMALERRLGARLEEAQEQLARMEAKLNDVLRALGKGV